MVKGFRRNNLTLVFIFCSDDTHFLQLVVVRLCSLDHEWVIQEVLPQGSNDLGRYQTVGVDRNQSEEKHAVWSQVVMDEISEKNESTIFLKELYSIVE